MPAVGSFRKKEVVLAEQLAADLLGGSERPRLPHQLVDADSIGWLVASGGTLHWAQVDAGMGVSVSRRRSMRSCTGVDSLMLNSNQIWPDELRASGLARLAAEAMRCTSWQAAALYPAVQADTEVAHSTFAQVPSSPPFVAVLMFQAATCTPTYHSRYQLALSTEPRGACRRRQQRRQQ